MEISPENQYVDRAVKCTFPLVGVLLRVLFFWFVISASEFEVQLHLFSKWTKI